VEDFHTAVLTLKFDLDHSKLTVILGADAEHLCRMKFSENRTSIFRDIISAELHVNELTSGGSGICQGWGRAGPIMTDARSASLNGGLGAELPAGSRYRASGVRVRGRSPLKLTPPEADNFLSIFTQKWPKVKDLDENRIATTSPKFWSMGDGRPYRP